MPHPQGARFPPTGVHPTDGQKALSELKMIPERLSDIRRLGNPILVHVRRFPRRPWHIGLTAPVRTQR
jgi:hypothetical protein